MILWGPDFADKDDPDPVTPPVPPRVRRMYGRPEARTLADIQILLEIPRPGPYTAEAVRRSGEMADAADSKSAAFTGVWVQVPPPAPSKTLSFIE